MRFDGDRLLPHTTLERGMLVFVAMIVLMGVCTHTAFAQEMRDFQCRMSERTDWGAILDCEPGYATTHDRILIYAEVAADWGSPGEAVVSLPHLVDAAVVFDAGADDTPNVVIVFSERDDGALVAEIYDDRNGDGKVSATVDSQGDLTVSEVGPVVQVTSLDGWWQRDGKLSFNLDIAVDGQVRASFGGVFRDLYRTDGVPETYAHVRDVDGDGRPDHEWRQIYLDIPEPSGYYRTEVVVNWEDDEAPITGALLWPYLGNAYVSQDQYTKLAYRSSVPPLDVDWNASQVTHVAEFVGSRTEPGNYFIYSIRRLEEGTLSFPNFENPFAFYDLSAGNATLPTLMIRSAYFGPRDPYFLQGKIRHANNDIVYVWRYPAGEAEQAPIWDYKIALAGSHEYTSIVEIGDLSLATVTHDEYPYWVTEKVWNLATFVALEGAGSPNSEGISEWGAILEQLAPESYQYVAGWIDNLSLDYFGATSEGYRGEVVPVLDKPVSVYISSVDRKLHIAGAEAGVWNIDGSAGLRYGNLDEDAYLDQWQYLEDAQVLRQLNLIGHYLVYAENDRLLMKYVDMPPTLFETLPPRNHEEWVELGHQLEALRGDFAPGDLAGLFLQPEGRAFVAEGVSARDLRTIEHGFRFVLTLHPGFRVTLDDQNTDWPPLKQKSPGEYVITCHDDEFQVESLVPPQPVVVEGSMRLSDPQPLKLEPVRIEASLYNTGLEDLDSLPVSATVTRPGSNVESLGTFTVTLPAEQAVPVRFDWSPTMAGEWRIHIHWAGETADSSDIDCSAACLTVQVSDQSPPNLAHLLHASGIDYPLAFFGFVASIGVAGGSLILITLKRQSGTRDEIER